MKILVTGGTGFLGRYLVRQLIDVGHVVRVLARPSSEKRGSNHSSSADLPGGVELITGDLSDVASLQEATRGVEAVCHCAALMQANSSWEEFEKVNVRGTERLLEAVCRERVCRFVHVSSLGIYGLRDQETITEQSQLDESAGQRGSYTRSKIESERVIWKYHHERGLPITVVRPGILYGPGRPFVGRVVIPLGSRRKIVVARRDQRIPLVYVGNAADAIHLALSSDCSIGKAYNIVDSEGVFQRDVLKLLKQIDLSSDRIFLVPPGLFSPVISFVEFVCRSIRFPVPVSRHQFQRAMASVRYDTSHARNELGWSPKVGLEEGVRRTVEANAK